MARPLRIAWQAEDSAAALQTAYQAELDRHVRTRLHALWLVRAGRAVRDAARVVGVHEVSVQQWLAWYRHGGLAEVRAHRVGGHGQPPRLTPAQEQAVRAEAARGAFHTAAEVRRWIAEQFGVSYGRFGIYSLLRRLRIQPKVPRPISTKTSAEAQTAWKRGISAPPSPTRG
jgi:transposase